MADFNLRTTLLPTNGMPQSGQRGRPSKDAAQYKDEVLSRPHTAGWKQQELVSWLADTKDLTIDPRTL